MFSRQCPACSKAIAYRYLKDYIKYEAFQCPHCCKTITVKTYDAFLISMVLGLTVGFVFGKLTEAPIWLIMLLAVLLSAAVSRYIELLWMSLKVDS